MGHVGHCCVRTGLPPNNAGGSANENVTDFALASAGEVVSRVGAKAAPSPVSEFRLRNSRREKGWEGILMNVILSKVLNLGKVVYKVFTIFLLFLTHFRALRALRLGVYFRRRLP